MQTIKNVEIWRRYAFLFIAQCGVGVSVGLSSVVLEKIGFRNDLLSTLGSAMDINAVRGAVAVALLFFALSGIFKVAGKYRAAAAETAVIAFISFFGFAAGIAIVVGFIDGDWDLITLTLQVCIAAVVLGLFLRWAFQEFEQAAGHIPVRIVLAVCALAIAMYPL